MTKRKFYIIKTLGAIGLSIYFYLCTNIFEKSQITDRKKTLDLEFGIQLFSVIVVFTIFIIGMKFLINYKRPKLPEEIEKMKK